MPKEIVLRRGRQIARKDQHYSIGGVEVTLPPESRLPYYQWRDPSYDAYAGDLLRRACADSTDAVLLDIGANVGDTAVLALAANPALRVVSVEGSEYFLRYLRKNLRPFGDRCDVVPGFVGPVAGRQRYRRDGGTGGFQGGDKSSEEEVVVESWVSVAQLLERQGDTLTLWKSDTDGFDIHLVAHNWDAIASTCDVIWMEFDPVGTLGPQADVDTLIDLIAQSGREVHVYDNVGHHMCTTSGTQSAPVLASLTQWLRQRRGGLAPVLYFDLWIVTPPLARKMWPPYVSALAVEANSRTL